MNNVVIISAKRTPMGAFQGALSSLSAPDLASQVIKAIVKDSNLDTSLVDEVYMGCVLSAGLGQAPARQAALNAGLLANTPCTTVNKVCGSGMKAVMLAADQIRLGHAQCIIAGGMESMSNAPYLLPKVRQGLKMGHSEMIDHMFFDGLQDGLDGISMGIHAQKTCDANNLSREQLDSYSLQSLSRALAAQNQNWFNDEIAPVFYDFRGKTICVDKDEQPSLAKPEKIPSLKPAFQKDGTLTAATSSSISDGASALLLMSEEKAKELNLPILARLDQYTSFAREPEEFTQAPIGAMKKLLTTNDSIDLFEINEAFASVPLLATNALDLDPNKVNIVGGACALGHPLGSSGSRILITLIHQLIRTGGKKGIASLCIGGGEATACQVSIK